MAEIFYHERTKVNVPAHRETSCHQTTIDKLRPPPQPRQRRPRTQFSAADLALLEAAFSTDPYPDILDREELAEQIGVGEARIQTWFQNKRSRSKRKSPSTSPNVKTTVEDIPAVCNRQVEETATISSQSARAKTLTKRSPRPVPKFSIKTEIGAESAPFDLSMHRTASNASPVRRDCHTEGALDLSLKSSKSAPSAANHPFIPQPSAGRPYFRPWDSPLPSSEAATTAPAKPQMAPVNFHPYPCFDFTPSPWLYGCISLYERKSLPRTSMLNSTFYQYMTDALQESPGLSPLVIKSCASSPAHLSPSIKGENFFVFPPVHSGSSVSHSHRVPSPGAGSSHQEVLGEPLATVAGSSSESGYSSPVLDVFY